MTNYLKIAFGAAMVYVLLLLNSCKIYTDISTFTEAKTDFSDYKTFAWLPDDYDTANSPYNNEVIRNNLKNYFGQDFAKRGFRFDIDTPDVLLQLVIQNKKQEKEVSFQLAPREFYYCSYYYCSHYYSPYPFEYYYQAKNIRCNAYGTCVEKIEYMEGAITLNMIDRKQEKIIWSCTAKGDIYDADLINRDIHPAAERMLKQFPVKQIVRKSKETDRTTAIYN